MAWVLRFKPGYSRNGSKTPTSPCWFMFMGLANICATSKALWWLLALFAIVVKLSYVSGWLLAQHLQSNNIEKREHRFDCSYIYKCSCNGQTWNVTDVMFMRKHSPIIWISAIASVSPGISIRHRDIYSHISIYLHRHMHIINEFRLAQKPRHRLISESKALLLGIAFRLKWARIEGNGSGIACWKDPKPQGNWCSSTERNMNWVVFCQKCEKYSSGANKANVFLLILVHF